jgi:hypothetical protein
MITVRQKMYLARVFNRFLRLARHVVGRDMWANCRRGGVNWRLDLDEGIDLCICVLGAYEPGTRAAYSSLIKEGDVVLDIGANIGAHTLHFARLVGPSGRVYAIEPTDYAAERLQMNLALNPQPCRRPSPTRTASNGFSSRGINRCPGRKAPVGGYPPRRALFSSTSTEAVQSN